MSRKREGLPPYFDLNAKLESAWYRILGALQFMDPAPIADIFIACNAGDSEKDSFRTALGKLRKAGSVSTVSLEFRSLKNAGKLKREQYHAITEKGRAALRAVHENYARVLAVAA